jgi:Ser/Thr protein kinase RdoA (MazF antagonist)
VILAQFSPHGNLYETCLYEPDLWIGYAMELAPGRVPKEGVWDLPLFERWGQLVGRLHRLAQAYPSWEASIDPQTGHSYLTWREEWQGFYEWGKDEQVRKKWLEIRDRLERLPVSRNGFGFIHNDPHQWNLLADGERLTLLDFDVANHHWFINDIAIACQGLLFSTAGGMERPLQDQGRLHTFLDSLLTGYERENHLDGEWLERLDLFIAYRRILLFTVMQGWIQSKPELHESWKGMILEEPEVVGTIGWRI